MSTNSQENIEPLGARPLVDRLSAWAQRIFSAVDIPSLLLATKNCLAIVLAIGIAFWLSISVTITAITALMIQMGYVGATINRGLMRFIGGTTGAIGGLVLLAFFGQERFLLIGSISLCTGVVVFLLQGTRNWYAYLLFLVSLVLVGFGSVENPLTAFDFAVTWGSGILVAVVVVSLVHSVLWPTTTADIFEKQLHDSLDKCGILFRLITETLIEGQDRCPDMQRTEQAIIQGLPKLRATLQTAAYDSGRMDRFQDSYGTLIDQVTSLTHVIIDVRENLELFQTEQTGVALVQGSLPLRQIVSQLDDKMQTLVKALESPRDGTSDHRNLDQDRDGLEALLSRLTDDVHSTQAETLHKAMLLGLHDKLAQTGAHISMLGQIMANVETDKAQSAARANARAYHDAPSFLPRFLNSVTASIVLIAVPCIWILTNWPMALHRLMIYTAVMVSLNALFPAILRRAILKSLAFGALGGGLLYFGILRPLDGFLELGIAMFLATLPCCYFINSPNPCTKISALFTGMIMIGLIDLSLVQSYSFATYANNLIGYSGGFIIAMIILQMFESLTPEQAFRQKALSFFQTCGKTLSARSEGTAGTDEGKARVATPGSRLFKSLNSCGLWAHKINPRRAPHNSPQKVSEMLDAMQSLMFRIGMVEQARFAASDDPVPALLESSEYDLRKTFIKLLEVIQETISGEAPPDRFQELKAMIKEFRHQFDSLRNNPDIDLADRQMFNRVLVLAGYYRNVENAIDQCYEDVKALDWQQWDRSYI